jgi:hypothetical protein
LRQRQSSRHGNEKPNCRPQNAQHPVHLVPFWTIPPSELRQSSHRSVNDSWEALIASVLRAR